MTSTQQPQSAEIPGLKEMVRDYSIHLRAEGKSAKTILIYTDAIRLLWRYLAEQGMPTDPERVKREHVEAFMGDLAGRKAVRSGELMKPNTISRHYRSLKTYFAWLVDEDEIRRSPMERLKPPPVPEDPPPVLTQDHLRRLLRECEGRSFADRRDTALLLLLVDTGLRRAEIAGIQLADIDWDVQTIRVVGKGRKTRSVSFGAATARALSRYERVRRGYPGNQGPMLWLGNHGALTGEGVYRMVRRRALAAGLGKVWTHLFRHSFAHMFLDAGGQEGDLMRLAGWSSRQMVGKYGAHAAQQRAVKAHKEFSPADRLMERGKKR